MSGILEITRRARLLFGCAASLAAIFLPSSVSANVYATDLKFSTHAVNANLPGASVDLSFRLNEPADLELRIEIFRADSGTLVRNVSLPVPAPAGINTYTWDLKDNSNNPVPRQVEYFFKVFAKSSGYDRWTQISSDSNPALQFVNPRSIDVNKVPNHPAFGRVYVLEANGGASIPGRVVTKGVYALNADLTDALGQGDVAFTGNVGWDVGGSSGLSPLNINVGPDGKLYLYDWSTSNQGVFVAPADLGIPAGGSSWTALLAPGSPNHGRISGGVVLGKGLDRTLYTVDLNLARVGSLWRYGIGALDRTFTGEPIVHYDNPPSVNANLTTHVVTDVLGNFYMTQYRVDGHDIPSLWKVSADGQQVLWRSTQDWGIVDILRGNAGSGVAIDNNRNRIVTASAGLARANVFEFDPAGTPDIRTAVALGNTALVWAVGDDTIQYSGDTGVTFTGQPVPEPNMRLNDVHVDQSGTGAVINGFAVGDAGKAVRITGRTAFQAEATPVTSNLNGVTTIRTVPHAWAVGDGGVILFRQSTALGWVLQDSPVTTDLNAVAYRQLTVGTSPTYTLAAAGDAGVLLRKASTDPAFTLEVSPVTADLYDISMNTNARTASNQPVVVFAVGDAGTIVRCNDLSSDSREWKVLESPTTANLRGVHVVTTQAVWAVGENGTVIRTVDSGKTWESQNSGTTETLREVYFADMQNGYIVGDNGVLLVTANGGNDWTAVNVGNANMKGVFGAPIGTFNGLRGVAFDAAGNLYLGSTDLDWVRVYSPPDGVNEFTTTSHGRFVPANGDATKPAAPVVTAPSLTNVATRLDASWSATGVSYRYAISVTPEDQGDYVVGWTETTSNSAVADNLSLVSGATYFFLVQARSATGVWSDTGVSNGTLVMESTTVGQAKAKPNGSLVSLQNVVVTKSEPNAFWVQEQDRSAGIKVISTAMPPRNALADIVGTVSTVDGIKVLVVSNPLDISTGEILPTVEPLLIQNKAVAAGIATGSIGLANDSLLVSIYGKVTAVDYINGVFYVDDGSEVENDTPNPSWTTPVKGIRVIAPDFAIVPFQGQYAKVTGVVGIQAVGNSVYRTILTRDIDDQQVVD